MKLIAKCLLCLLILTLVLPATAYALGGKTYTIEEMGLTLEIPIDLIVLTRGMDPDDPDLKRSGLTANEWAAQYREDEDFYMWVIEPDWDFDITVTMDTNYSSQLYDNYANLSPEKMKIAESVKRSTYVNYGVEDFTMSRYDTPQVTYLKMQYKDKDDDDSPYYAIEYQTYYDGRDISLTLFSYDGPATKKQDDLIRRIVDSAVYAAHVDASPTQTPLPTLSPTPRPAARSSMGGTHAIPQLGLTLTIPEDLVVFGQSIDPRDPNLLLLDLNAEDLEFYHRGENIYLDAIAAGYDYAITAARLSGDGAQASDDQAPRFSEDMLHSQEALRAAYVDMGATNLSLTQYKMPQVSYFKVNYELPYADPPYCSEEYLTLYNGQVIGLSLRSYIGPVTGEQQEALRGIVDTALFDPADTADVDDVSASAIFSSDEWDAAVDGAVKAATAVLLVVLSILLTITLYTLPLLIYRYAIRKAPLPKAAAIKTTVLYGIAALIITVATGILLRNAAPAVVVVLWSWVNYLILKGGRVKQAAAVTYADAGNPPAPKPSLGQDQEDPQPAPYRSDVRYCTKCGTKLSSDGFYCSACGAKIDRDVYM